jgi:hypothetical protein
MIRAHQPGSQPIDIPEVIPNPAVVPKPEPAPSEPAPRDPVKVPEKVSARYQKDFGRVRAADLRQHCPVVAAFDGRHRFLKCAMHRS